jgi:hypothetical protein
LFVCGAAEDGGCTEVLAEAGGLGSSAATLFSVLPGLGSETATVLFGRAAGDCPEAEVVKNVADVNANATEALVNARGIDT